MPVLRNSIGDVVVLMTYNRVGRARGNELRIPDGRVSGEHAVIFWRDGAWWGRDLASRNGSWVNGERLDIGEERPLKSGDSLAFGSRDETWVLQDDGPPVAVARNAADGSIAAAEGGVLRLPGGEITRSERRWFLNTHAGSRTIENGELVELAGQSWRIWLPGDSVGTRDYTGAPPRLAELLLRFQVSSDEEHVEVTWLAGGQGRVLAPRSYHYLLLTLARLRLEDGDGWVHIEDLARMLRADGRTLNVHINRLRQQLADEGVEGAEGLIERRRGTGQLRIGVADLEVGRLGQDRADP